MNKYDVTFGIKIKNVKAKDYKEAESLARARLVQEMRNKTKKYAKKLMTLVNVTMIAEEGQTAEEFYEDIEREIDDSLPPRLEEDPDLESLDDWDPNIVGGKV